MRRLALGAIRLYQQWISGNLAASCIYQPTCSAFAYDAVEHYGVMRGSWMAARRIARCHPFAAGGYDPLP